MDAHAGIAIAGTWLAQPRVAASVRAVESSATARSVIEQVAHHPTRVAFEAPPATVEQFERRKLNPLIASYAPATNTMGFGAGFGVDRPFEVAARDGSKVVVDFGDTAVEDGVSLVHESVHRLQNRAGRLLVDVGLVQPIAAPIAGVRQLLHPNAGETRAAAFMRGFDRRIVGDEIEAYRTEARVEHELGRASRFNDAAGTYLGDDHTLARIHQTYVPSARLRWAASLTVTGSAAAGGIVQANRSLRRD